MAEREEPRRSRRSTAGQARYDPDSIDADVAIAASTAADRRRNAVSSFPLMFSHVPTGAHTHTHTHKITTPYGICFCECLQDICGNVSVLTGPTSRSTYTATTAAAGYTAATARGGTQC